MACQPMSIQRSGELTFSGHGDSEKVLGTKTQVGDPTVAWILMRTFALLQLIDKPPEGLYWQFNSTFSKDYTRSGRTIDKWETREPVILQNLIRNVFILIHSGRKILKM